MNRCPPVCHTLKTDPEVYDAVASGAKTFEIRFNDRGFQVGDALLLRRTVNTGEEMAAGAPLIYSGEEVRRVVSHVFRGPLYGLADGWVILSLAQAEPGQQARASADLTDTQIDDIWHEITLGAGNPIHRLARAVETRARASAAQQGAA